MNKDTIETVKPKQDEIKAIEKAEEDIKNGEIFDLTSIKFLKQSGRE